MKTKIVYLITKAEHGGAQTHVADLLAGFSNNLNLNLLVGEEGFLTDRARELGVQVHILPDLVQPLEPVKDLKAIFQAIKVIKALKPDLVHCHSSKAGLIGRVAAKVAGVPAVFTAHGWGFADGVSWPRRTLAIASERACSPLTSHTITVSEADRQLAIRYRVARASQLTTIQNGVADLSRQSSLRPNKIVRLIVVARFAPQKDHLLLLNALTHLEPTTYELLLIGDGPTRSEVEQTVKALELQANVSFLGTRSDIPELLATSDVFVLPSNWEGFPISILEAMRAGLPVIASDVGGSREAVENGKTGFLVPRGDAAALTAKLAKLVTDPALRAKFGSAGRAKFESEFTLDQTLSKTLEVYNDVLAIRGSVGRRGSEGESAYTP